MIAFIQKYFIAILIATSAIAAATIVIVAKVFSEDEAPLVIEVGMNCSNLLDVYRDAMPNTRIDGGGVWTVVDGPPLHTLTDEILACADLSDPCDNPCIDLFVYGCGVYQLRYQVSSETCLNCEGDIVLTFRKCCTELTIICSS